MAQTRITGNVTDEKGEPVIGASILVKGTDQGTVTDLDGDFSLSVPSSSGKNYLIISYMGMKTQEVEAKPNLAIVLKEDATMLGEVEITAEFGMKRVARAVGSSV